MQLIPKPPENLSDYVRAPASESREESIESLVRLLREKQPLVMAEHIPMEWASEAYRRAAEPKYHLFVEKLSVDAENKSTGVCWNFYFELRVSKPLDPTLRRSLEHNNYQDPQLVFDEVYPRAAEILRRPGGASNLSKPEKTILEKYQAAYLAVVMQRTLAGPFARVTLCVTESDDFDCVIKADNGTETAYKQVQLKELPCHEANPSIEIQSIIDELKRRYPRSSDLVVVIWINRDVRFDFSALQFEGLNIEHLYLLGNDAETGEIRIDGGRISELIAGIRWTGGIKDGIPSIEQIRFKSPGGNASKVN